MMMHSYPREVRMNGGDGGGGILRPSRYTVMRRNWREYLLPAWQIGLALIALIDIWNAWSIIVGTWMESSSSSSIEGAEDDVPGKSFSSKTSEGGSDQPTTSSSFFSIFDKKFGGGGGGGGGGTPMDTCAALDPDRLESSSECGIGSPSFSSWLPFYYLGDNYIGPIFCILCIVNGVIRARRAQQLAYENAALDVFESKLAKICSLSRTSFMSSPQVRFYNQGSSARKINDNNNNNNNNNNFNNNQSYNDMDQALARKTLRIWGPVAAQLTLWFVIIPWTSCWCVCTVLSMSGSSYCDHNVCNDEEGGGDSALLTIWVTQMVNKVQFGLKVIETHAWSLFWKRIRQWAIHNPIKLYLKFRQVFRWIRFVRYAGPLLRMVDKVQNHTRDLIHTWQQNRAAERNKMNRIQCKADIQQDIRKLASTERLTRAIRSKKSQLFKLVPEHFQTLLQRSVGETLATEKKKRAKIKRKVDNLTMNAGNSWANLSEVYDQIVDLTEEVKETVKKDFLYDHLIPPNTKFSVAWRVIVSGSLVIELLRLWLSWKSNGDFTVSLEELLKQWVVTCDRLTRAPATQNISKLVPEKAREIFMASGRFLTFGRVDFFDRRIKQKLMLEQCLALDVSYTATLAQHIGRFVGIAIDIVNFLDIFVWFNTGQIDQETGTIVPKPFFSRCIVPGTLVQVFDHPTLPTILPMLLIRFLRISDAVGYARVVRWGMVLEPACTILIVDPLKSYLFSPAVIDTKSFASMALQSPEAAAMDSDYGYGFTSIANDMNQGGNLDVINSNDSLNSFGFYSNNNIAMNNDNKNNDDNGARKKRRGSMIFNQSFVY